MWWTPHGERSLKRAEWDLFREGLDLSWDWVEESMDDPDCFPFDAKAFDELQPSQRLALLAFVASALNDKSLPRPELTAHSEATIAAIFNRIAVQVTFEIDAAAEGQHLEDATFMRRLILAAYREVAEQYEAEGQRATAMAKAARSDGTPPTAEDADEDDGPAWSLPAIDSDDLDEWTFLIYYLANEILWEDGDYEMGDDFMDDDPLVSEVKKSIMGIADNYYAAIAPDPTDEELVAIRQQLHRICGRTRKPGVNT